MDSYYCDSGCSYTNPICVSVGDNLNGTIKLSTGQCDRGYSYDVASKDLTSGSSTNLQTCAYPQVNVYVTLEVKNVVQCSDYPSSSSSWSTTFDSIKLVDDFGTVYSPSWTPQYHGASPTCSFNVQYSSSSVTLYY